MANTGFRELVVPYIKECRIMYWSSAEALENTRSVGSYAKARRSIESSYRREMVVNSP